MQPSLQPSIQPSVQPSSAAAFSAGPGLHTRALQAPAGRPPPADARAARLAEDGAAVLGVLVAMAGIGLAQLTGDPRWDAAGSLLIGLLLGGVAIYLIRMNRSLLIGKAQ